MPSGSRCLKSISLYVEAQKLDEFTIIHILANCNIYTCIYANAKNTRFSCQTDKTIKEKREKNNSDLKYLFNSQSRENSF